MCSSSLKLYSRTEELVYAGNTTYTTDSHPNSTKPRHRNNMNVKCYKTQNTHRNKKQTYIKGKVGVSHWNGQRQILLWV